MLLSCQPNLSTISNDTISSLLLESITYLLLISNVALSSWNSFLNPLSTYGIRCCACTIFIVCIIILFHDLLLLICVEFPPSISPWDNYALS